MSIQNPIGQGCSICELYDKALPCQSFDNFPPLKSMFPIISTGMFSAATNICLIAVAGVKIAIYLDKVNDENGLLIINDLFYSARRGAIGIAAMVTISSAAELFSKCIKSNSVNSINNDVHYSRMDCLKRMTDRWCVYSILGSVGGFIAPVAAPFVCIALVIKRTCRSET